MNPRNTVGSECLLEEGEEGQKSLEVQPFLMLWFDSVICNNVM